MALPAASDPRRDAFAELRARVAGAHAAASPEAFTLAEEAVLRTGLPALDAVLGGGVPRGIIATLSVTNTRCEGSGYGKGLMSAASTKPKIVTLEQIPKARISTEVQANPGFFRSWRNA